MVFRLIDNLVYELWAAVVVVDAHPPLPFRPTTLPEEEWLGTIWTAADK